MFRRRLYLKYLLVRKNNCLRIVSNCLLNPFFVFVNICKDTSTAFFATCRPTCTNNTSESCYSSNITNERISIVISAACLINKSCFIWLTSTKFITFWRFILFSICLPQEYISTLFLIFIIYLILCGLN